MNDEVYVGRFVVAARTENDDIIVGYRVSSRSFANRRIIKNGDICSVMPIKPEEYSDNPYVSYNCLRHVNGVLIVSNGSQTDHIAEKVGLGYPVRDALASCLLAMDYEKDKYDTPRIACTVDYNKQAAMLAIVKPDKLEVRSVALNKGEASLVATYELTDPWKFKTKATRVDELATEIFSMKFTHPVCSLSARLTGGRLDVSIRNP